jgi:eukaryotic translation initiation factor 2C
MNAFSPVIKEFFSRGHQIMYVGIDLSHPAPGSGDRRSIAAVVASADDIPNRYFKEVYIQDRSPLLRKESVENVVKMKEIMKSLISQYEQHRGFPPKAIIIYRDGISNSEFDTVFEKELTAIREACVESSPVYQPSLTYIVVNKRHHTRFFPNDLKSNVVAGTVVDSPSVTNPTTYNFFLNSHHAQKVNKII